MPFWALPTRQSLPPESKAAVRFEQVSVRRNGVTILEDVTASVPTGSCTAIVGPNGAGKTTLLLALLGQIPFEGTVRIFRPDLRTRPRIGYLPQRLRFDRGMPMTVMDFLALGMARRPLWLGLARWHREAGRSALLAVGAESLERRPLAALSGGEVQRVLLALALSQDPDLLILDEPAAGVDVQGGHVFCELLERLRTERGFTQLMVTHDLSLVTHHATHVILLNRRVIAEGLPQRVLTLEHLSAVFGLHMGLADARGMPEGQTACPCASRAIRPGAPSA